MLTEQEVRHIKNLKANIHHADLFLFKGVKTSKVVGSEESEVEEVAQKTKFTNAFVTARKTENDDNLVNI